MTTDRRPPAPPPLLGLLAALATLSVAWVLLPGGPTSDIAYLVLTALPAAVAWAAVRETQGPATVTRLLTASLTAMAFAEVTWFVLLWSGHDPDGSVADVVYLGGYALLGAALVVLLMPVTGHRRVLDTGALLDVATVVTVCVLLMWELAVRDVETGGLVAALTRTELIYPLVDAVLIGIVLRALADRRARGLLGPGAAVGMLLWLLGDLAYLGEDQARPPGSATSVLWLLGTVLLAATTVRLARAAPLGRDEPEPRDRLVGPLLLAIAPLAVPPGLVVVETVIGRDPESWSLVVGILVLLALACWRTARLLGAERRQRHELAAARDAALRSSAAKSGFLAGISQEIRGPMNGVLGLSRLLGTTPLDADQRSWVEGIERAGEQLLRLLDEVSDFARHDDARMDVASDDVDVPAVVDDVAAMVAEQALHHGVELVAHCSERLLDGHRGDGTKLRQVLLNLASNAVAHTTAGEVEISARPAALGVVRFEVRDTGRGIAPDDLERIFEPFTQLVVPVGSRPRAGAGLGLPIARSLAERMGGRLGIESAPGVGTTAWFEVPLPPSQARLLRTQPSRAQPGTRVLLAEDNPTGRRVVAEQLRGWGLEVVAVVDGETACAELARAADRGAPYRLVVADLSMPGVGGLDLVDELRRTLAASTAPGEEPAVVVALTSGADVPSEALCRRGVQVSVPKPVAHRRLQAAVQRSLGHHELPGTGDHLAAPPVRGVVLVVEDSDVDRIVAVGSLKRLGYLVERVASGEEAVAAVAERNYDAVLVDCRMPGMDGFETTRALRAVDLGRRVPVIGVSTSARDRERCLEAGMDDHLTKPLTRHALRQVLERWVPGRTPVS